MGSLPGLMGMAGGAGGSGFSGPESAGIDPTTNSGQIGTAYTGVQGALGSQQALLDALQKQNGIGNQSQVYNQLQGVANGTGPNPAQAQLAQSTGQNVANQAALMAGQRGAGSNVGLMARQAAQQGAGIQQGASGQAATLQAQQSLNALNSAGNIANTQVGNQIGATGANTQAQQSEQQALLGAQGNYNNTQAGMQGNINNVNGQLANTQMQGGQGILGGIMNGAGSMMGARGGQVQRFDSGGVVATQGQQATNSPLTQATPATGAQSSLGKSLKGGVKDTSKPQADTGIAQTGPSALMEGASSLTQGIGRSMSKPSQGTSQQGNYAGPDTGGTATTMMAANGGMTKDFRSGGKVKATSSKERAVAPGNSYSNDKIPAVLSEHEIVIPRSVTLGKDPVNDSAAFVAKVLAKRKSGR